MRYVCRYFIPSDSRQYFSKSCGWIFMKEVNFSTNWIYWLVWFTEEGVRGCVPYVCDWYRTCFCSSKHAMSQWDTDYSASSSRVCSHLEAVLFAIRHSQLHYDEDLLCLLLMTYKTTANLTVFCCGVLQSATTTSWFHAVIRVYWFNARQTIMWQIWVSWHFV